MTEQPLTQAQDHDRRIGRLEGIAEQLDRRLDSIERVLAEQSRRIDALNSRIYWVIGIQLTTLIALGTLIVSRYRACPAKPP